ncbi:metallophosphoesterase [Aliarcobacter faecis]|uniref:metallophosphoesterase family protein n=1 Tax=Aliarcobacter faecis TaxID=1564138 RepID=UPI00047D684C|nr:metallophosphoesterase family protein [Aliarcobacter faecis]QKF72296.1 metallophosphoesterase [Aliarcobacter faecis]
MYLILLSDIHANLEALTSVLKDIKDKNLSKYRFCILGDVINYGVHTNEVLEELKAIEPITEVLLAGNHEMAFLGIEDNRFSSQRGKDALNIIKDNISIENSNYIKNIFTKSFVSKIIDGKKYLFIHGSLDDIFWGTINPSNINENLYKEYDVVFSGHSHKPHFFEIFYKDENSQLKERKKTIFINPGSVGQPRNLDNSSQYAIFDTLTNNIQFCKVSYDIKKEQEAYKNYNIDKYYKDRLEKGV